MGLSYGLDVVHLERIPVAALVHRSVEQLNRLDSCGIEARPPMPISVRERVREDRPVRVRRLEGEVDVDLVEPLPDLPEVLDQGLVEFQAGDVLFPDILDDFLRLLLQFRVQGGEPIIPLGLLRRHGQVPSPRLNEISRYIGICPLHMEGDFCSADAISVTASNAGNAALKSSAVKFDPCTADSSDGRDDFRSPGTPHLPTSGPSPAR